MINNIGDIIFFLVGIACIVFSKQIGHATSGFHKKLGYNFSERGYRIAFILAGTLFVLFSLSNLLR